MSDIPEDLFQQLYKRAPNGHDKTRLIAAKSALGLSSRDEMWPIIMTLDYYAVVNQSARNVTINEMKTVIDAIKEVTKEANLIATIEARKTITEMIDGAADRISKDAVEKSEALHNEISNWRYITAAIVGCLITLLVSIASATGTAVVLKARGICAEHPQDIQGGDVYCLVERALD